MKPSHNQDSKHIHQSQKLPCTPLSSLSPDLPCHSHLHPQATTDLLYVTINWFIFSRVLYEWNNITHWFILLSIIIMSFILGIACPFLLIAEYILMEIHSRVLHNWMKLSFSVCWVLNELSLILSLG